MNDVPASPPRLPPQGGAQTSQTFSDAPVEKIPDTLLPTPQKTVTVEGRVSAVQKATGDITVTTTSGDVVIRSAKPLPVDTQVKLDITVHQGKILARVHVTQTPPQHAQPATGQTPPTQTPLPTLKVGDTVAALYIPPDIAPPSSTIQTSQPVSGAGQTQPPALQNITPTQIPEIITALKNAGISPPVLQKILPDLPAPLHNALHALWQAPDSRTVFAKLTTALQNDFIKLIQQPRIMTLLESVLPQNTNTKTVQTFAPPSATPSSPHDAPENIVQKLLHLLRPAHTSNAPLKVTTPTPLLSSLLHLTPDLQTPLPAIKTQEALQNLLPKTDHIRMLTIMDIRAPNAPPPTHTPAKTPDIQIIEGKIDAFTRQGQPIIKTEQGDFVFKIPIRAPQGHIVRFESSAVTPQTVTQIWQGFSAEDPPFDLFARTAWPALEETLTILQAAQSPGVQNLRSILPTPTQNFTPTTLLFLAVLQLGKIENWLGQTILTNLNRQSLIERLTRDFGRLADQAKEQLPGGWRMISMPLLHDEGLNQIQMFFRHQQQGEETEDSEKQATRFVVNFSLSRMGNMQIDGLARHKKLDLKLRTENVLPDDMQNNIIKKFTSALEQTGMEGQLVFQAHRQDWLDIQPAMQTGIQI